MPYGHNRKDLTGNIYASLTVVKYAYTIGKVAWWECICECGNTHIARASALRNKKCGSCGCQQGGVKHGFAKRGKKPPEYTAWSGMRDRCNNPKNRKYSIYGGRGITVCKEWDNFQTFYEDMGEKPTSSSSLDRIDPDKGYSPDNCRWANKIVQKRNQRENYIYTLNNQSMTLPQWIAYIEANAVRSEPIGINL